MFLLPHPQGQESSVGRGEAAPIPRAPPGSPQGNWAPATRGSPRPPLLQFPKALPIFTHYCFSTSMGGQGRTVPSPGHSESNDRHRRQPQSTVHQAAHKKAASEGSSAEAGCLWTPGRKLRQAPTLPSLLTGACVDEKLESPQLPKSPVLGQAE